MLLAARSITVQENGEGDSYDRARLTSWPIRLHVLALAVREHMEDISSLARAESSVYFPVRSQLLVR
jgi:hypothetical protein